MSALAATVARVTVPGVIAFLVVAFWGVLLFARDGWWRARERDDGVLPEPAAWGAVVAVVPARDEAAVIGRAVASLAAQDYPGDFRVVVVDDGSSDATAAVAQAAWQATLPTVPPPTPGRGLGGGGAMSNVGHSHPVEHSAGDVLAEGGAMSNVGHSLPHPPAPSQKWEGEQQGEGRLTILRAPPLAAGWTGKLAAVAHGIAAAGEPAYLWLTDADIEHAPDTLRSLVARAVGEERVLVSLMARLRTASVAERALVPAFVWFFAMLFPFAAVNRAGRVAAAAGGVMLVDRAALAGAGGIGAIRGALIDDCALAALMKSQGRIGLYLTRRSVSLRPCPRVADIGAMIARSAYAQLGYSPLVLVGTIAGLALTFVAPPALAVVATGAPRLAGLAAWAAMAGAFQPMLSYYRRSALWGVAVPGIAAVYGWYTIKSAFQHLGGRGGQWKGRVQAALP